MRPEPKRLLVSAAALAFLAATIAACNTGSSGSGLVPVVPPLTTTTYTGTVQVSGNFTTTFVVNGQSELDITLTAAGPPSTIVMGLGVGQPAAPGSPMCIPFASGTTNTAAGTTAQLSGQVPAGTYCVEVYDVGNQTAPVNVTVTVSHL
jgi:hypothetical protein